MLHDQMKVLELVGLSRLYSLLDVDIFLWMYFVCKEGNISLCSRLVSLECHSCHSVGRRDKTVATILCSHFMYWILTLYSSKVEIC